MTGVGTLEIPKSLSWTAGTMSGSGSTVLGAGAEGTINPGSSGSVSLIERDLVNHGTLTWSTGTVSGSKNAEIDNSGTFDVNGESPASEWPNRGLLDSDESNVWLHNTGTVQKTAGAEYTHIGFQSDNEGMIAAKSGVAIIISGGTHGTSVETGSWAAEGTAHISFNKGTYTWGAATKISGPWEMAESARINAKSIQGEASRLKILRVPSYYGIGVGATLALTEAGVTSQLKELEMTHAGATSPESMLIGAGTLEVSESLSWTAGTMSGSGSTVLGSGAVAVIESGSETASLTGRALVNKGTATFATGVLAVSEGAKITNSGTFKANSESGSTQITAGPGSASIVNHGTFEKTAGAGITTVAPAFENYGTVRQTSGTLVIGNPVRPDSRTQFGGTEGLAPGQVRACEGDPVSCATGNESEAQTDFVVGGRGVGLDLTRTYNSQAGVEGMKGLFGYGWSSSFEDHLVVEKTAKKATLHQADGAAVTFAEGGGESFTGPASTQDTLSGSEASGYTLTLADQTKYKFAGTGGRLESMTDRFGNETKLTYNGSGQLTTITDPASRAINLLYNGEGLVEDAEDPMKHVVKYTYESGNLKSVTQPGEAGLRWQFKYDGSHQMTEMIDGRGGKTINEYNASHQVTKQEDPASHKLKWEYETFHTKITNENTGAVTNEYFTSGDEPSSITHGYGTASEMTESFMYNEGGYVTSVTDGNGHTTTYEYDSFGNKTKMVDPNNNETNWEYNSTHDVISTTTPKGETTTIKREADGNPEAIERPAPESKTQTTKYTYGTHGELKTVTNPLSHKWEYEYDTYGDRSAEIDPLGNKRTWEYNADSQETATVSPRGNIVGGKPAEYKTTIERDAQGRHLNITDPLGHTTKYTYDGDGNIETVTDGNSHTTKYTYNSDNEQIKVETPNKTVTETEYDGAGQAIAQIDGNKHKTEYKRNVLEQVTEVINPLGKITKKEYDAAGNLKKLEDAAKRTTTYTYDPANRLIEVVYSNGNPATTKYEYDKDGKRVAMTDGTGTTKYVYDQLDRLTENENGHKEIIKYEYDLANDQTKITYPSEKTVTRVFDNDGRLEKVTDWNAKTTQFAYNKDSELNTATFPSETTNEDTYTYNDADQMTEVKMTKGTETLASLTYVPNNNGEVENTTSHSLPGPEETKDTYDENNRLTKTGSIEYEYDAANNPTKNEASTQTYNTGDELEKAGTTSYTFDELGERTKATPEKGPATSYGYDQTGNLTSVERPKEGETPEIKDTYAYNGTGLRTSQTINGATTYMAWDTSEGLPSLLSDGTNSYIYGPDNLPVEQINNTTGTVQYLHHDQAGSTRLITGSTGTVEGSYTYTPYGATEGHTGTATTPLGFDGQYTSTDTGLIYLRARVYDPTSAQFMSADPLAMFSRAPYTYASDNPLNAGDPLGLLSIPLIGDIGAGDAAAACGATAEVPGLDLVTCGAAGAAAIYLGYEATSHIVNAVENEGEGSSTASSSQECEIGEAQPPTYSNPDRNMAQDKKLSPGQIKKLKDAGYDPHELKLGAGEDLYTDADGNIYAKPQGGAGPGEPIGINIKNLP